MKIILDSDAQTLRLESQGVVNDLPLYSAAAFEALSREWVRVGWAMQQFKTFTWLGLPIQQLPEDLVRLQEVFWRLQPDIVIECGICMGGSLLFHAGLCEAAGKGRVIGVDKHIDPATRSSLENHRLGSRIAVIEGDSAAPETVRQVRQQVGRADTVMVILDSDHSRKHVLAELEAFAPLVTPGSCIVAADGIMRELTDVPGGEREWTWDNPAAAAADFLRTHPEFEERQPMWQFNLSGLRRNVTYWPEAWLWRK